MTRFYEPDLGAILTARPRVTLQTSWFVEDSTLVMVMTKGLGANLTNDEKRAHLIETRAPDR